MRRAFAVIALLLTCGLVFYPPASTVDAKKGQKESKKEAKEAKKAAKTEKKAQQKQAVESIDKSVGGEAGSDEALLDEDLEFESAEETDEVPEELGRGLDSWAAGEEPVGAAEAQQPAGKKWQRAFEQQKASVQEARKIAGGDLKAVTGDILARVLFVLEMEAPGEAQAFKSKVAGREVERKGKKVQTGKQILTQAAFYRELYRPPCRGAVAREGTSWPPVYVCRDAGKPPTGEPAPLLKLSAPPQVIAPPGDDANKRADAKTDAALAAQRKQLIKERDAFVVPGEELGHAPPGQFCYQGKCFKDHRSIAAAIYGGNLQGLPVFCAPKKSGKSWDKSRVECSANWLETLGSWKPWKDNGEPSAAPEPGSLPPYACFGGPHVLQKHMILPPGADPGPNGFACRNRVFRVLVKKGEKSAEDKMMNIAQMCSEMRSQVWGEKYGDINAQFQQWCRAQGRKDCLPVDAPGAGLGAPPLPFMELSREELLFFYGHRELFCRADRPGLTHFLFNKEWGKTFTCDVPRGLLEAGPFEEGVQVCAIAPYVGGLAASGAVKDHDLKARLHCWQFNRPTCEDISRDQTKDDIHRSSVFDAYDALREARRTRHQDAWALYDLKDADKLEDFSDALSFSDSAKDEGTLGVRDFCRFDGDLKRIQCGYTKQTMAQYYELRQQEEPEGCGTGVCARGAYKRGYLCGVFASPEVFSGRPYWMCGVDIGAAGRKILDSSRAVCVGGARATVFQSPKGDKTSLQCYERRFRWGESAKSEDILRRMDWANIVETAAKHSPRYDNWLHGGDQARRRIKAKAVTKKLLAKVSAKQKKKKKTPKALVVYEQIMGERDTAKAAFEKDVAQDMGELRAWASEHGHTLGHRTSMRVGLMSSTLAVVKAFKELSFPEAENHIYRPLGSEQGGSEYAFAKVKKQKKPQPAPTPPAADAKKKKKEKKKDWARDQGKVKSFMDLLNEVRAGEGPADGRWYQQFRQEATEDGKLRIEPKQLAIALRMYHVFKTLDSARLILLSQAKSYVKAVFETARAKGAKRLSRPELHESARSDPLQAKYKDNLFCASDEASVNEAGLKEYVCASSPLLIAGAVELAVDQKAPPEGVKELPAARRTKLKDTTRGQVSFDWCFGGTEQRPLFGWSPSPALYGADLSSPFFMDVPEQVASQPKGGAPQSVTGLLSATNWVKCAGFQYSDEQWEGATIDKKEAAKAKKPKGKGGGKAAKITASVGKVLGPMVRMVLPLLGEPAQKVADVAHAAGGFLDKWVGKFVETAKATWEGNQGAIEKLKGAVEDARAKVDEAKDAYHRADLDLAAAPPPAKKQYEEKKVTTQEALNEAKKAMKEKQKELKDAQNAVNKQAKVAGTGAILGALLEELVTMVTGRVTQLIDPHARKLLARGFKFVRSILGPIAKAVISALASVPFVGGALAALGQVAYDMALDMVEKSAGDALMGLVERLLAKGVRAVVSPLFRIVQEKIADLAYAVCAARFPEACPKGGKLKFGDLPPKDRWIERALACPARPLIDERVYRDARIAHQELLQIGAEMRRNAVAYARDLADHHLARFGYSYDSWMAAVAGSAPAKLAAQAEQIEGGLKQAAVREHRR